tara:strand:- start:71 stop:568 length:498 start_codon:yes stop_codon:yes gene_type:complete
MNNIDIIKKKYVNNEYVDSYSLCHLMGGIIFVVMMKSLNYSFLTIFILGNLLHLIYEYLDYNKVYGVFNKNKKLIEKIRKKLKKRNHFIVSIGLPFKTIQNNITDQLFHIIGLILGYYLYPHLKSYSKLFIILFILFWGYKLWFEYKFYNLNIHNENDVIRYLSS